MITMKKFWMKLQEVDQEIRGEVIVAVCDEELLGKNLTEHTKISEQFYKGELVGEEKMIEALEAATTANIFGNNAVEAAINAGIIERENVKEIKKVKYCLIFSLA